MPKDSGDEKKVVGIIASPYQSDPFTKGYSVKLPSGYGDRTHPKHVELSGKGMRQGKGK